MPPVWPAALDSLSAEQRLCVLHLIEQAGEHGYARATAQIQRERLTATRWKVVVAITVLVPPIAGLALAAS